MKVPSTLEALEGTQKLLSDPARWCQGDYTNGDEAYCLFGALRMQYPTYFKQKEVEETLAAGCLKALKPSTWFSVTEFNDRATHEEVLALISKAITFAKEKGL